jgi:hypothetical protein
MLLAFGVFSDLDRTGLVLCDRCSCGLGFGNPTQRQWVRFIDGTGAVDSISTTGSFSSALASPPA